MSIALPPLPVPNSISLPSLSELQNGKVAETFVSLVEQGGQYPLFMARNQSGISFMS
jgi:hypothetical protein